MPQRAKYKNKPLHKCKTAIAILNSARAAKKHDETELSHTLSKYIFHHAQEPSYNV